MSETPAHGLPSTRESLRVQLARLRHGDPFHAHDAASAAAAAYPDEPWFRQVQAHALARAGAPLAARQMLEDLVERGHHDAETLGLLGRVWKDLASVAPDEATRRDHLQRARESYREGLERTENRDDPSGAYPGINAAALSVLLGEMAVARNLATRASRLASLGPRDYWAVATLAEAALIDGDLGAARALYAEAQPLATAPAQLATTRRQARILAACLFGRTEEFDTCFHIPPVVVFTGHLADPSQSTTLPRFPQSLVPQVATNLRQALARLDTRIGYAAAARGGDLLFLEALRERHAEASVVLPFERQEFFRVSVAGSDSMWHRLFDEALAHSHRVAVAARNSATTDGLAFEFGLRYLFGLARLRAHELDTSLRALVMWDGQPDHAHAGTAWAISYLLANGVEVENVFPSREGPITSMSVPPPSAPPEIRQLRAILFADCKGFSHIPDEQLSTFIRHFYSSVADLVGEVAREYDGAPLTANTWGDGLFFVFPEVLAAGSFALNLRDALLGRRPGFTFPPEVRLRIALHAAPLEPFDDPITQRPGFIGSNLSFAARIEPIADENQVFVSEPFAVLAAGAGASHFHFEYLGLRKFAKDFGSFPLYRMRHRSES